MFKIKHLFFTKDIYFYTIIDSWLIYKYNSVKESTYLKYKYMIKKYLYPELKYKTLKELINYDYNNFISKFYYLNNNTIKTLITILKSILKYTERKHNVDLKLDLIQYPKTLKKELEIFSDKEKQKLISYCYNDNSLKSIGILICLYTGIRLGELCALKWKDINLKTDIISINETLQRAYDNDSTKIIIGPPKSTSSIRKIPINKKLHNILYSVYKLNKYDSNAYFLTGTIDKFIEPRNYQYTFKKIQKNLNIPNHNFHILRHTFATDCIKINMDVKSLSRILGHANVNITLNKYVHPSFDSTKKYLEKI
ncbi:MAG: site-specific integrase [Clostridia bacterium]|nr:site-specific integrase [Clostridia bacterium]